MVGMLQVVIDRLQPAFNNSRQRPLNTVVKYSQTIVV
jgi:hypothetical protein